MVNRLTEKHIVDNIDCGYKVKKDTCEDGIIQGWNKIDAINKLGKLEDIEEEIGIDLTTLFKALKNGIVACYDNEFGGETKIFVLLTPDRLSIEYKNKCLRKGKNKFYFKDYGRTWALTKEELES